MLVVIPYWAGDKHQAVKLAEWMRDLGGVKHHRCLLIVDFTTDETGVIEPLYEAFIEVEKLTPHYRDKTQWGKGDGSTTGDATCPNNMFRAAATWMQHKEKCPWIWLEPDAVPLKKGWLDEIEEEYKALGKPFMGDQVLWPNAPEHMSGVGVYPARVCDYSILALRSGRGAFDVNAAHQIIKHAAYTNLIQHVWRFGGPGGQVPTFPTQECLRRIEKEAVIFHRCKDGTLIDRLRENLLMPVQAAKIAGKSRIQPAPGDESSGSRTDGGQNNPSEVGAEAELRAARTTVPTPAHNNLSGGQQEEVRIPGIPQPSAQSYSATSVTVTVDGLGNLSGGSNAGEVSNNECGEKKSGMGTDQRTNPSPAQAIKEMIQEYGPAWELREKRRANMAKARAAKKAKAEARKAKHLASFPPPDAFHKATGR